MEAEGHINPDWPREAELNQGRCFLTGFSVITSQRCKDASAEESYSNALSLPLQLSVPQSLMKRLAFDRRPRAGTEPLLIRE